MCFKKIILAVLLSCLLFGAASCRQVAITGRKQLSLVSDSEVESMALQQYGEFINQSKLSRDPIKTKMVKDVGNRIARAVEQFLASKGQSDLVSGYNWEFNLVVDDQVNAWAMPGGKIVIYTGILPVTRDETGLAVVMSHEIAHVIARHGNERLSHELARQLGYFALSEAVKDQPDKTKDLYLQSFGIGTQVGVLLPYSRTHEAEADRMGMIFMALAGYNPTEAVDFWQRMANATGGSGGFEFLSTHPSNESRVKQIKNYLPEAMGYYKGGY